MSILMLCSNFSQLVALLCGYSHFQSIFRYGFFPKLVDPSSYADNSLLDSMKCNHNHNKLSLLKFTYSKHRLSIPICKRGAFDLTIPNISAIYICSNSINNNLSKLFDIHTTYFVEL